MRTPYHHHAKVFGCGVDCVHLLIAICEASGCTRSFDPGNYACDWHIHRSEEIYVHRLVSHGAREVEVGQPGDLALFRFGRTFSHSGLLVGNDQVIHAYIGRGVILTRLTEEPLADRPVRYWTLEDM